MLGTIRHPLGTSDFASYLVAAQASGAQVVVLCNAGTDATNAYKQAIEFGLPAKQTFVTPIMFLSDVYALGAATGQGLQFTQSWYWDQTDATRAWAKRYEAETRQMPNDVHAATYSAVLNYLRAISQAGTDEAHTVMKTMKAMTIDDVFTKGGHIRADGKMVFDRFLAKVKAPANATGPWDLLSIERTIPAADGFRPLSHSECPLVKS